MSKLRITQKDARLEALTACAALLKHTNINRYEGNRISESDDDTQDAWFKIECEKMKIIQSLCKRAKVRVEDLDWEND